MRKSFILAGILSISLLLTSCGGKEKEEKTEEASNPVDALQAFADKAKEMGDRKTVDPVDFRRLKELLPETLVGLERTEATGEKSGAMGFTVSTAEARYKKGEESINIGIVDTGGIAGVSTMALAGWSIADIDKETATGYEKTTTIEGYKAFEKYDTEQKSGEINILVADRYVVNVDGNNVTIETLTKALKDIDLTKLSELK